MELYFRGCGLETHDLANFMAWAEHRKLVKHLAKQAKRLPARNNWPKHKEKELLPQHCMNCLLDATRMCAYS